MEGFIFIQSCIFSVFCIMFQWSPLRHSFSCQPSILQRLRTATTGRTCPVKAIFSLLFPCRFFLILPSCLSMFCNHVISPFPALAAGRKDAALKKQQTRRRLVSKITVSKTGSREYAGCPAHSRDLFLSAFSSQQDVCAYSARMSSTQSLSWVNRATGRTSSSVYTVISAK